MIVSHQWPRERTWGVAPATFRAKKTTEKGAFLEGGTTQPRGEGATCEQGRVQGGEKVSGRKPVGNIRLET